MQTAQQIAEILQVRLLDQVVSMPVVAVQTVQPVEIPQLQFLDKLLVFHLFGDNVRVLCDVVVDFLHKVVVSRKDVAVRSWRSWMLEEHKVHP